MNAVTSTRARVRGSDPHALGRIGRYVLSGEIGFGGMATIHLGRLLDPVGFTRTVAVKRLHPPFARDPEFVGSLLDEARLASRVRHPNVVPTLDVVATGGELFVVMEFILGESFAQLLGLAEAAGERVPVPITAAILVGVLHGLHAAHEACDEAGEPLRIVHRDVSPHNILVGVDGAAHIIDFGIAKARGRSQLTRDGQIKGKLAYMPPEQIHAQPLDARVDVFAASVVLWEALAGRRLFLGVDEADIVARVLHGSIDPPSRHHRAVPPALDALVLRGLARDRTKRFASARDMALALESASPLASASQIGAWVERLAGPALAERARQLAEIEQVSFDTPGSDPGGWSARSEPVARVALDAPTSSEIAAPARGAAGSPHPVRPAPGALASSRARWWRRSLAVLAMTGAVGASVLFAGMGRTRSAPARAEESAAGVISLAEPPPATASPSSPPPPPEADEPLALSAGRAPPRTPSARPPRAPGASGHSRGHDVAGARAAHEARHAAAAATAATAATAPPPPPPACDPPFWYDPDGNKHYYRECARL